MNKANIIIFSFNRPCQLELLLRSMKMHWNDFDNQEIKVIYTYSNDSFEAGYNKLKNECKGNIEFVKQVTFRQNVINCIDTSKELVIFGTDDDVFIRDFDLQCKEVDFFKQRPEIITLSLRLGKNISYCYTQNRFISRPLLIKGADYNLWNWTEGEEGDWTYPFSLDFNLYETDFILPYIKKFEFRSPNTLEGFFARIMPYARYLMMGFDEPKIVNLPINRVQMDNKNRHGRIPAEFLNYKYLDGYVIDYSKLEIFNGNSCHIESKVEFIEG